MKKLSRILVTLTGIVVLFSWLFRPTEAVNRIPLKGEAFPSIRLPMPKSPDEKRYLGVSDGGSFGIFQIRAKILIVEVYSFYCPQCQAFAPEVNALYQMIEQIPGLRDQIKLIGIGAGNSPVEVKAFTEKHDVPFPLFPDEYFTIHKLLGEVRTPYFFAIKINPDRSNKILYSEPGGFGLAENFLQMILDASGLK